MRKQNKEFINPDPDGMFELDLPDKNSARMLNIGSKACYLTAAYGALKVIQGDPSGLFDMSVTIPLGVVVGRFANEPQHQIENIAPAEPVVEQVSRNQQEENLPPLPIAS